MRLKTWYGVPTASAKLEKSGDQEMPLIAGHRTATRRTPASDVGQGHENVTGGVTGTLKRNELYCRRRRPSTHIINPPFSPSLPRALPFPSLRATCIHTSSLEVQNLERVRGLGVTP